MSPALAGDSSPLSHQGSPHVWFLITETFPRTRRLLLMDTFQEILKQIFYFVIVYRGVKFLFKSKNTDCVFSGNCFVSNVFINLL